MSDFDWKKIIGDSPEGDKPAAAPTPEAKAEEANSAQDSDNELSELLRTLSKKREAGEGPTEVNSAPPSEPPAAPAAPAASNPFASMPPISPIEPSLATPKENPFASMSPVSPAEPELSTPPVTYFDKVEDSSAFQDNGTPAPEKPAPIQMSDLPSLSVPPSEEPEFAKPTASESNEPIKMSDLPPVSMPPVVTNATDDEDELPELVWPEPPVAQEEEEEVRPEEEQERILAQARQTGIDAKANPLAVSDLDDLPQVLMEDEEEVAARKFDGPVGPPPLENPDVLEGTGAEIVPPRIKDTSFDSGITVVDGSKKDSDPESTSEKERLMALFSKGAAQKEEEKLEYTSLAELNTADANRTRFDAHNAHNKKQFSKYDGGTPISDLHIDEILAMAVERKASDIHLTTGLPPMVRLDGEIVPLPFAPMQPADVRRLLYDTLDDDKLQKFETTKELDFSYPVKGVGRFRVNMFVQRGSVAGVMRSIPQRIPSFDELGLPPVIREMAKRSSGLILVTGPTGSGKSTTIAAMIDDINKTRKGHIMTIEDPIEYLHHHQQCIVNQRELHADTFTFHNALRAVLREDPDIILVGELRDLETIEAALTLAETGHLVFGTLHTRSAPSTVDRIIDVFPPDAQEQIRVLLSNTLEGVVSQQLLPRLGGGRVASIEIMIGTPAIRNLAREGKTHQMQSILETSGNIGMQTMDATLAELYRNGTVEYEECLMRAIDKETFSRLARAA